MVGERGEDESDPFMHRLDVHPDFNQVADILVQIEDRSTDLVRDLLRRDPKDFGGFGLRGQGDAA